MLDFHSLRHVFVLFFSLLCSGPPLASFCLFLTIFLQLMLCHLKLLWISPWRRLPCGGDSSPVWQRWLQSHGGSGQGCDVRSQRLVQGVNWERLRWLIALFEVKTRDRRRLVLQRKYFVENSHRCRSVGKVDVRCVCVCEGLTGDFSTPNFKEKQAFVCLVGEGLVCGRTWS